MNTTRLYNTEAVVLKKSELGEADNILTLYTPFSGKLRVVAKGARRPKSKLGGHVELLTYSEMLLVRSHNLGIVSQSQTVEGFLPLRNNLRKTSSALYVVELFDCFTVEGQGNHSLFRLLVDTLHWLCEACREDLILRCFELHFFAHLGYQPQLQSCVNCYSCLEPCTNLFAPSGGGVLCHHCSDREPIAYPLSLNALKVLRFLQRSDYASVSRLQISHDISSDIKYLMRSYIRYFLEREVKSAEWLDRLEKQGLDAGLCD